MGGYGTRVWVWGEGAAMGMGYGVWGCGLGTDTVASQAAFGCLAGSLAAFGSQGLAQPKAGPPRASSGGIAG